jgi:hypothetical protein
MDDAKMSALDALVASLGNVSRACREAGIPRSLYYKWKRASTGNTPRRRHPQAAPEAAVLEILRVAGANPEWGCDRIAWWLELRKFNLSATTVQKILWRHGLGRADLRKRKVK